MIGTLCREKVYGMSYDSDRQAGAKREELRTEIAKRLIAWENSAVLAQEFADDLIEVVLSFYPDGRDAEKQ